MAAETQTLNFGPEWLRALSSGGSITSPPLSPALPKYKLADYRYGREEMLALYEKYLKVPVDLTDKEFIPILQEEPLPPLALVPFTEEEQRNFSMSVNSAAVLRLMGRGGGTVVGAARGRSSSRGRGRGRGDGGFYQRSFDEGEVGFGRGVREMHRSQSWEERGERRFDKPGRKDPGLNHPKDQHSNLGAPSDFLSTSGFPLKSGRPTFEEMGTSSARKHEITRSESENWRVCRDEQNGEDDDGGWRLTGHRREGDGWQPHSAGWREAMERRRRFEFDYRDRDDERSYRRVRSGSSGVDDEKDCLPEWCLEDAEEEMGTFDSSGAFMSLKKTPKEPIPEEQELDFKQIEDGGERLNSEESEKEAKEPDKNTKKETDEEINKTEETKNVPCATSPTPPPDPEIATVCSSPKKEENKPEKNEDAQQSRSASEVTESSASSNRKFPALPSNRSPTAAVADESSVSPPSTPSTMANRNIAQDNDDDEGLKHLEQEAEKMVASLQDNVIEDERLSTQIQEQRTKSATLPLSHEAAMKWFYKDPQGEIQGSFTNQEMAEWFQAGYFTMSLLVKRGCDEGFQPLGEVIKMWGRVPFAPGASPPPLLSDLDQERLKRQQELATLNLYQMQQIQYQLFLQAQLMTRQQYAQAIAHHQKAAVGATTSHQQQQQQQQQEQQLAVILEQFQALKLRSSEQSLMPPVTRSMTVPDSNSIWELQTPQASGWDCDSVWDLPVDSSTQGSSVDQIQQMERGKGAKLEQERRETGNRAKREEEEKKQEEIRHQEELLRRQEEEKKRREEEHLMRKKQEETLRRQREHEAALCRQREEEERKKEEARRRHEERQREEEERRQREELLRKQEEERRRKDEEAARWMVEEEEARRRAEEDNRLKIEEETRLRLEEEEQKRKDLERHKEMQKQEAMRQRQQQQEALRRLQQQQQQQQLAQMKLPSSSTWGQQSSSASSQFQGTLSLSEIQKLEEERERQLQEERRQQQTLMKALQQQQNQQQKLTGWGNIPKASQTTKSLLEIQQEEFSQMQKQKENRAKQKISAAMKLNVSGNHEESSHKNTTAIKREESSNKRSERNQPSNLPVSTTSVWGSVNTSHTNQWGTDINSVWGAPDNKNTNVGFWDEAVKEVGPTAKKQTSKSNKNNSNPGKFHGVQNKPNKKAEEEEKLMKLFHGVNKAHDGFTLWCEEMLQVLNTANNLDVPTFVSFLKEVDSQYEVHDYIRAYLGDTPETQEFAKQFLGRRAKQKVNQQRQLQQQDSEISEIQMTGLESIYPSNHSRNQQPNFECVQAGKRKKKQKMIRADPSILGFSVNASSERLNMGEIETLDDY